MCILLSTLTSVASDLFNSLCIELSLPPLVYLEVIHHIRQHCLICCIFAVPRIKTNQNVAFCYHMRILFVCNYAKWVKLVIFVELFSLHDDPLFGSGDVSSGINKHTWGRGGVARAWPAAWQELTRRLRKCLACLDANPWRVYLYNSRKWVSDCIGTKLEAVNGRDIQNELEYLGKIGVCHGCFTKLNAAHDFLSVLKDSLARLGQCKRGANT